ncbi:MAG: prohibitin family protein [Elusimicrobiales bacterium]|nr:prohibitin family protein [Elusimicrobiales bacterium]
MDNFKELKDFTSKATGWTIIAFFVLMIGFSSYFIVEPGEVAVKTRLGAVNGSYGEGLHFKLPFFDEIVKFSIQIQRADIRTQAFSKDLQTVNSYLVVNHRIQQDTVESVYRNLGKGYVKSIVDPMVQERFKSIVAKYSADAIITNRSMLVEELNKIVKEVLYEKQIIVTDISIVDLDFSAQFLKAVEDKQVAEQQAKMAEKLVEKAKKDAEQQIAKARAEAESLRMQREAVTPSLIELRKVEAQIKAIEKWNGVLPYYNGGAVPFIQVDSTKK